MSTLVSGHHALWTGFEDQDRRFQRILALVLAFFALIGATIPYLQLPPRESKEITNLPPPVVRVLLGERSSAVNPTPLVSVPERPQTDEPADSAETGGEPGSPSGSDSLNRQADGVAGVQLSAPAIPEAPPLSASAQGADTTVSPETLVGEPVAEPEEEKGSRREATDDLSELQIALTALQNRPVSVDDGERGGSLPDKASEADSSAGTGGDLGFGDLEADRSPSPRLLSIEKPMSIARLQPLPAQRSQAGVTSVEDTAPDVLKGGQRDKSTRSREEIMEVLDRHKGILYALYNKALESRPALSGKVLVSITIAATGRVTDCRVESTDMGYPAFEDDLVRRIRRIDFGPKPDTEAVTRVVPIEFLPT